MGRIREQLARFMYGRYGVDQLYYGLFAAYLVVFVANLFVGSGILGALMWVALIAMIYRSLSRDIPKRRIENEKFLKVFKQAQGTATRTMRRVREINTHRYRKCPSCGAVLRLPKRTGTHTVTCPRCKNDFKLHIRW